MIKFFRVFDAFLPEWLKSKRPLYIAYSGGRDSHVLLHALSEYQKTHPELIIEAIHINHAIHPDAAKWATHCAKTAEDLGSGFETQTLHLGCQQGDSLEAVAREKRYAAFEQLLLPDQILMTAHTQDDQAETFLLQALRGSGPKGLAGIAPRRLLGDGILLRPLLTISREDIAAYAETHQLKYIDDPSNDNKQFRRNFIRHDILPLLKSTYPSAINCLARSSQLCQQDNALLTDYLKNEFEPIFEEHSKSLPTKCFNVFSRDKQMHLLRHWFMHNQLKPPSKKMCAIILDEVVYARMDRHPSLALKDIVVKRVKRHLVYQKRNQTIKVIEANMSS